jgi:hypothetical protein
MEESKEQAALAKIYNFKEGKKLDNASLRYASGMYAKYCALCHGKDREGYAADFAPSLRSHSLMAATQLPRSSTIISGIQFITDAQALLWHLMRKARAAR